MLDLCPPWKIKMSDQGTMLAPTVATQQSSAPMGMSTLLAQHLLPG